MPVGITMGATSVRANTRRADTRDPRSLVFCNFCVCIVDKGSIDLMQFSAVEQVAVDGGADLTDSIKCVVVDGSYPSVCPLCYPSINSHSFLAHVLRAGAGITIRTPGRMWELLPETASEAQEWFRLLRQLLQVLSYRLDVPLHCAPSGAIQVFLYLSWCRR